MPDSTGDEVAALAAGAGIDRAVITSTRSLFVSWPDGNQEARQAAAARPERLIAFAVAGPGELSHSLDAHRLELDNTVRGVRLFPQFHTYHLLYEPFVDLLCEQAAALRIPVQLPLRVLMNWGMPMLDLGWMAAIVGRHPATPWILSGLNYFHELRVGLALMRRYPTVYLETSCIQGFDAIRKVVEEVGSDRLLFGTGLPLQNAAAGMAKVCHARISDAGREAVLGGNALRLLKLEDQ
ncbi:MAG: amidohydrolase family protein [Bryobacterales bacterium]|nr:amidohydrolase family protein [Bryobacterales bacterium]